MKNENNRTICDLTSLFVVSSKWDSFVKTVHTQPWRLFYFCFLPKKIRQRISLKADIELKKRMASASQIFIRQYINGDLTKFNILPKKKLDTNKVIWQYWGQGIDESIPDTVKICFNSVDRYKNDYQVIRLDDSNLNEYIDLPDFVWKKKENEEFGYAFLSDIIRLAVLNAYGGIWMDATILLTDYMPHNIVEMDFFMFQRDECAKDKDFYIKHSKSYFGWHQHHYVNVLNSFIVSKSNGVVVHACLDLLLNFWMTQTTIKHYFFFQILFNELMKDEYYKKNNCPIIDDTLIHTLQAKMAEPFQQADFDLIKTKSSIHKLTYIKKCIPNSYYDYIRNTFIQK